MNIFEQASRQKLRFDSIRGELSVEQLWDLSLTSKNGFDLDSVAKAVNQGLKSVSEESFVSTRSNPAQALYELRMEIIKHVITARLEEKQKLVDASKKAAEKQRLLEILDKKQSQELEGLSVEELQKRISEL